MGQEARYLFASSVSTVENQVAAAVKYLPWLAGAVALYYFFKPGK